MLESKRQAAHYAKASRLNQRINQALQQENAAASGLLQSVRSSASAQAVVTDPGRIASASAVWMSFTFLLCYLALPLFRTGFGMSGYGVSGILDHALAAAAGLMGVMALFTAAVTLFKPTLSVDVDPDKILSATAGSLLVWAVLHNILPFLVSFGAMGTIEFGTFFLANGIESALFGVMLASFAATGRSAFSLGAMFQFLMFSFSYIAMFAI